MYEIGTLILYDKRGVYKIEGVGAPPVRGTSGDYYKLCAVFSNSNEITYTPVDTISFMRPLISSSEAAHYLELFSQLEPHAFRSSRTMELTAHYQDIRPRGEEKKELEHNPEFHARRWVVEVAHSFFNRFRKLLVRFEKKADNYLALIQFACAVIVWRKILHVHR